MENFQLSWKLIYPKEIPGKDFCDFEAALLKLGKDYCKKRKCDSCPLGIDCLYCQNWHWRECVSKKKRISADELAGYVDEQEVENIAEFIASLDKNIPYSLLAFHPHFYMDDLPTTSRNHAFRCLDIARKAGLKRVRIGNIHLLGETY